MEDFKIPVKLKLSALWVSVMFCYVYGDFFTLFVPGHIDDLANGNSGTGKTTPLTLLAYAIMMSLPALMIFLCLMLKPGINKWLNIITGILFSAIMVLVTSTSIGEWMIFYTYLGIVEIILTLTIVWHAGRWPKQAAAA